MKNSGTEAQSDMLLWIAAGTVAAIAIAWFAISQLSGGDSPAPTVASVETAPTGASETAADTAVADGHDRRAGADDPLRAARLAFDAGMLTEPADYSAWTLFGTAFENDPSSTAAVDGLRQVAAALLPRGDAAVEQGRYEDATGIADMILARLPEHAGAASLLQRIEDEQARQRERELERERERAAEAARASRPEVASAGSVSAPSIAREEEAEQPSGPSVDERLAALQDEFESAVAANRLLAPADDSAKSYAIQMRDIEAGNERTVAAIDWLVTEMLSRSNQSSEAADWASAETWIDEAEALGADTKTIVDHRFALTSRMAAVESEKWLPISEMTIRNYVAPEFPRSALSRGVEGWVDVEFRVTAAGQTIGVTIADASHDRLFHNEAIDAVSEWEFEPREFMGQPIDQNVYTRLRFVFDD